MEALDLAALALLVAGVSCLANLVVWRELRKHQRKTLDNTKALVTFCNHMKEQHNAFVTAAAEDVVNLEHAAQGTKKAIGLIVEQHNKLVGLVERIERDNDGESWKG